jgi:S1-C subfamily serine protease
MTELQDNPESQTGRLRLDGLGRARRRSVGRIRKSVPFASGVVAALIAFVLYGLAVPGPKPLTQGDVSANVASALASVTPAPPFSESAYQAVAPSLVLIEAQGAGSSAAPISGSAAPSSGTGIGTADAGIGSGVIVDTAGDIMTALHVVAGASSIKVTFADGTTSSAQISTSQAADDIAVLKADQLPATIVPAVLGNPRSMQVGSEAYVLGNPFGLDSSFSAGVVSGLNRTFQLADGTQLQGLIQVDAAINPGNSGGPLVNRNGQVVGIVSGIVNPTSQNVFIGIGFAVPIDVAGGAAGLPHD